MRIVRRQLPQPVFHSFKLKTILPDSVGLLAISIGKRREAGYNTRVLLIGRRIFAEDGLKLIYAVLQYLAIGSRGDGEERFEILHEELSFEEDKLEFFLLQGFAERPAQDREENLAIEAARRRVPIDVKAGCIGGLRSIFQHVHPPGIFAAC